MDALLRQALTISALREARNRVLTNHGCAGVDGQTVDDFAAYGDAALRLLAAEVQGGRYHCQPLLRLWIPKGDGKPPRGLAVPAVRDRVLQTSVATVLTPLAEAHAEDASFGYRKGRSVQQAVGRVERLIREGWCWIVDADIEAYFDTIDHGQLLAQLAELLPAEPRLRALVAHWLTTPVREHGVNQPRDRGVPQGSPLSPLLANLFLDALDEALLDADHRLVRFADDFVILARSRQRADAALELSRDTLERLALRLNPAKTRIVHSEQGFEFLGWSFVRTLALPRSRMPSAGDVPAVPPPGAMVNQPGLPNSVADTHPGLAPADPKPDADLPEAAHAPTELDADGDAHADADSQEDTDPKAATLDPADPAGSDDPALPALAPLQRTLYLVDPECRLEVDKQRLAVTRGERRLLTVSALNVDQVVVFGPVQVTTQAMQLVSRSGGAIAFLSRLGRYYGRYEPADGAALGLLQAQFQCAADPTFALAIARRLVAAKLRNSATVLARTLRRHPPRDPADLARVTEVPARLREAADGAERAANAASLRGLEGSGAALYFQTLARLLPAVWPFPRRVPRPAPDAVNALLSLGYSLLYQCVAGLLRGRGLHAHLGLFHASGGAHMALASDLMEPYRAYAVDAVVLRLVFSGRLAADCGALDDAGSYRLGSAASRELIHAMETRFNTPQMHPRSREPMDFKRLVDADVRQLAQALRDGQAGDFWPAVWD